MEEESVLTDIEMEGGEELDEAFGPARIFDFFGFSTLHAYSALYSY